MVVVVGLIIISAVAVGDVLVVLSSDAIVKGLTVIVDPAGVSATPDTSVRLSMVAAALAAPAVRAETATAAIKIFFIDMVLIPLEVL